jgi:hypothetical protein
LTPLGARFIVPDIKGTALNPSQYVIYIFGGVRATARLLDRSPSAVSKWRKSREEGGTGGQIPTLLQKKILEVALQHNWPINPNDLIYGRNVKRTRKA